MGLDRTGNAGVPAGDRHSVFARLRRHHPSRLLAPVIADGLGEVAREQGIHIVFNMAEPAIAWASPTLDVTTDVVKKLDTKPALPHD